MLFTIVLILFLLCCGLLSLVILVQSGKGGGLSGAFGGGGGASSMLGGSSGSGLIGKVTWYSTAAFLILAMAMAKFAPTRSGVEAAAELGMPGSITILIAP